MNEKLYEKDLSVEMLLDYLGKNNEAIENFTRQYKELMAYYRCAIMEVETKFNVLNEELSLERDRNPIESIKTRLKSPESILGKLKRLSLHISIDDIENYITDIAGLRIVCAFPSDVYALNDALLRQDDIKLIKQKDYIKKPKPGGYRSLHTIIEIPIFLHNEKRMMKVEVQFRTMSMDWWAALEHKMRYKKNIENPESIEKELLECAELAAELDNRMEKLRSKIEYK